MFPTPDMALTHILVVRDLEQSFEALREATLGAAGGEERRSVA